LSWLERASNLEELLEARRNYPVQARKLMDICKSLSDDVAISFKVEDHKD